jgi:hypothetical protein
MKFKILFISLISIAIGQDATPAADGAKGPTAEELYNPMKFRISESLPD